MLKYAFLINSKTLTPQTYGGKLRAEGIDATFAAVSSMVMACETVKMLVQQEGVTLIDLCGDFDEAKAEEIKKYVGKSVEIRWAKYHQEEMEKLEKLDSMNPYGIIVNGSGCDVKKHSLLLESNEFNTIIMGVDGIEQAKEAAGEMVAQGVAFIELCSYFNGSLYDEVIKAIDGAVPVGTAGEPL